MKSIFTNKSTIPTDQDLKKALDKTYELWKGLAEHTKKTIPGAIESWNFSGEKYGWSYRLSEKKRVIIYLLPRDKFFKIAFVFGLKATDAILKRDISEMIKKEIREAKVYAEGRGIRIEVKESSIISDIKKMIEIKIAF